MSTNITTYKDLYKSHISDKANYIIIKYDPTKNNYQYRPYSHYATPDAIDNLSKLIIDDMVFYAFTEEEIVNYHNQFGLLDDMKKAAKFAYESRIPKRKNPNTDGTPGEVLLDILIQVYEPQSEKLIARAKYKQLGDNSEIKNYDAMYFTRDKDNIYLWLGQVKSGSCSYCKSDIKDDLNKKYVLDYLAKSMFYIAQRNENNSLTPILNQINKIYFDAIDSNWSQEYKVQKIVELFNDNNIKLMIPCLLAYTADIYSSQSELECRVNSCTEEIVDYFDSLSFDINEKLNYEILYYVFPIQNVQILREKVGSIKKK